jgi:NAD(P)-dependent dehydrogenase (short-subunit alcohol dehydrogenase family)
LKPGLAGRVAIVTGAAKPDGIGHAVALGLAREGADVVVADLYATGFPEVTRAVEAAGRRCLCVHTDVADPASVEAMVTEAVASLGRIDVLVNGVGGSWGITPEDLTAPPRRGFVGLTTCSLDDWRTILGVNLSGAFYCARAVAPHLAASRGGAVVNFASVAARKGLAPGSEGSSGPYAVAKAGIMAMTRQLALELAPHGVRVNCVAPGVVMSGRAHRLMAAVGKERGPEGGVSGVPLGRFATVAEVAELVVALCCDETGYMTGVTVDVNGASYNA